MKSDFKKAILSLSLIFICIFNVLFTDKILSYEYFSRLKKILFFLKLNFKKMYKVSYL